MKIAANRTCPVPKVGKIIPFLLSFFLFSFFVTTAQNNSPSAEKNKTIKVSERTMQFKHIVVKDKSSDLVVVDGRQFKWFSDKEKAIEYFKNISIKRDLIIVYIDTDQPEPVIPEYFTVKE